MDIPEKHKKISKYEICKIISKRTGISEDRVTVVVNAYHLIIKEVLKTGLKVVIKDFGSYDCIKRKRAIIYSFNTETMKLEKLDKYKYVEEYVPKFKFSSKFANEIKRKHEVFVDGE